LPRANPRQGAAHLRADPQIPAAHPAYDPPAHAGSAGVATATKSPGRWKPGLSCTCRARNNWASHPRRAYSDSMLSGSQTKSPGQSGYGASLLSLCPLGALLFRTNAWRASTRAAYRSTENATLHRNEKPRPIAAGAKLHWKCFARLFRPMARLVSTLEPTPGKPFP
jgi:hypothetical protein